MNGLFKLFIHLFIYLINRKSSGAPSSLKLFVTILQYAALLEKRLWRPVFRDREHEPLLLPPWRAGKFTLCLLILDGFLT